jgi:NADPH:quinone reductase-like Zn-dependent oxidoreductase
LAPTISDLIDDKQVTPAVDRVLPLSSAAEALQLLLNGSVRCKLVLPV